MPPTMILPSAWRLITAGIELPCVPLNSVEKTVRTKPFVPKDESIAPEALNFRR
ncbi:MAG: hypothetical protein H7Z37_17375 [Pyrinomonadaceae bacterium]|nr:hypothetical protein [Pyrinomonadaceae bacterium]